MRKTCYVVATTINVPNFAREYCDNFETYGHKDQVGVIIIGDKKSPVPESREVERELQKRGFDVDFLSIEDQEKWLESYQKLKEIIPYNTDNRRNIGFLIALERGCEFIIAVDDDNFPLPDVDFFKAHSVVGSTRKTSVVSTESRWFNVCELLQKETESMLYPRGYPYEKRHIIDRVTRVEKNVQIGLNAGLWLHDPDVDSISRIHHDVKITGFDGDDVVLDIGTWSPINTQNTGVHRDVLPAYYFVPMREPLENLVIDRYGDIWAGLFTKKVMDAMGLYASFGNPMARHLRNKHDLFKDLREELGCIMYTDLLARVLGDMRLVGSNAIDLYADLSNKLKDAVRAMPDISPDFVRYVETLHYNQHIWLETVSRIAR